MTHSHRLYNLHITILVLSQFFGVQGRHVDDHCKVAGNTQGTYWSAQGPAHCNHVVDSQLIQHIAATCIHPINKLIYDTLCIVCEIAKLGFPDCETVQAYK